ncbi:MAG: chitobiase/beta-hexosaminidase C-terminal domain-containing protein, partial [Verrucomicrobiae bacterium]|nr:chitobiase/beta-hexosaminidase C-terminal domain-containing protein [Verrucomicrobiae bacterium]
GNYTSSVQVSLSCATSGATIRYTTNGTTPTSTSTAYSGPFTLTGSATVKAKAFRTGYNDSGTASADFTVAQTPKVDLADDGETYQLVSPTTVKAGGTVSVRCDIANEGDDPCGAFDVSVYLSTNSSISTSDTFLGRVSMASIKGKGWATMTLSDAVVPASLSPRSYYVGWIIDPSDDVEEFDETNNTVVYKGGTQLLIVEPSAGTNRPPSAASFIVSTNEDQQVDVRLRGSDPDGDKLTYRVVSAPKLGKLTGAPPALVYVPDVNKNGLDSFEYIANDGKVNSARATAEIFIVAVDDPPKAKFMKVDVTPGKKKVFRLQGTDVDSPRNELRYQITKKPKVGKIKCTKSGKVTYIPKKGFTGKVKFKYLVKDRNFKASKPQTVVLVVKDSPEDWVPDKLNAISVSYTATKATYSDDLGPGRISLSRSDLTSGPFKYKKLSSKKCQITFSNVGGYSGKYVITFKTAKTGTYVETYSGPYSGKTEGTFKILSMDTGK